MQIGDSQTVSGATLGSAGQLGPWDGSLEVSVERSLCHLFSTLGSGVKFQLRKKRFSGLKIKILKPLKKTVNPDSTSFFGRRAE